MLIFVWFFFTCAQRLKVYDKVPPIKKQKLHQANSSSINFLTFMPLENLDSPFHSSCMSLSCGRVQKPRNNPHRNRDTEASVSFQIPVRGLC